ncbi:MAG: hypothetical protein ABIQ78_08815, partial [Dokdonella sp.]
LALWVPAGRERLIILAMTYCVVVFSIFAQGLSVPALIRRATRVGDRPPIADVDITGHKP